MSRSLASFLARIAANQLLYHRARTAITLAAVAVALSGLLAVQSFCQGYERALAAHIQQMGYEVLVTVKGCPYEAATLILQGGNVPMYVHQSVFDTVARDPAVAGATRFLMHSEPDESLRSTRVFMGVDDEFFQLKPWMAFQQGRWFRSPTAYEAVLGYNVAERLRLNLGSEIGFRDSGERVTVCGVFDRTGTQDDGTIFLPLERAQRIFDLKDKLTGVGVKLRSLDELDEFATRANELPAVQVITMSQVQATILRLLHTGRAFTMSISLTAVLVAVLGLTNSLFMSVAQRTRQIGVMRAVGASCVDVTALIGMEATLLWLCGCLIGILLVVLLGPAIDHGLRQLLPYAPPGSLVKLDGPMVALCLAGTAVVVVAAAVYPCWWASRIRPALAMRE